MRKGALVDILTNLFNVWPNRKQLDSLCFCILSVATITSGKKPPLSIDERMRVKRANEVFVLL